jgi:AcrR family transcriptional regulator
MPRPSLKHERTEELLNAFMSCVARYGLDGSTLEQISKKANVARPLLRHYLGNRDEMIAKLLTHVVEKFTSMTEDVFNSLPSEKRFQTLISLLFHNEKHSSENAAVFQALVAASDRYPEIKKQLLAFIFEFEKMIAKEIMLEKPTADIENCNIAASGLTAIYFNTDAVRPLNPPTYWQEYQKRAAINLVDAL